ncbi:hypothetical protein MKW98_017433, partial [Papaver atlanticum]
REMSEQQVKDKTSHASHSTSSERRNIQIEEVREQRVKDLNPSSVVVVEQPGEAPVQTNRKSDSSLQEKNLSSAKTSHASHPTCFQFHNECVSRNSAMAIPTPWVRVVVNYDADSDDENWLNKLNAASSGESGLSIEMFEHVIDKLERDSYNSSMPSGKQAADMFPSIQKIADVYKYWKAKRKLKKALISVFKPRRAKRVQKEEFIPFRSVTRRARSESARKSRYPQTQTSSVADDDVFDSLQLVTLSPVRKVVEQQVECEHAVIADPHLRASELQNEGNKVTFFHLCLPWLITCLEFFSKFFTDFLDSYICK